MRLLILCLCLCCCSGCLDDDVDDLTRLVETEQMEIYRTWYAVGIRDGLIMTGVPESDATYWAELRADEVFNGY